MTNTNSKSYFNTLRRYVSSHEIDPLSVAFAEDQANLGDLRAEQEEISHIVASWFSRSQGQFALQDRF
jgi:hypothetical protein